jgi:hypothetical protein
MKVNKKFKREPIILSKNNAAMIYMYHRCDELEDILSEEVQLDEYILENYEQYEKAGQQFISQLNGRYCVAFMKNLIKEGFKAMAEKRTGGFTKESANEFLEELKKINDGTC